MHATIGIIFVTPLAFGIRLCHSVAPLMETSMRKEKTLAAIIEELRAFPPDSTVEPIDGGALVIHLPNGQMEEVVTFTDIEETR